MSVMDDIVAVKKAEIAELRRKYGRSSFGDFPRYHETPGDFTGAVTPGVDRRPPRIIAEIKKASPSAGVIRAGSDPARLAIGYQSNGAAAISVLTDYRFFGGSGPDLASVRDSVTLPLLRKDFILDELQVYESRALGADAVLLIASLLEASALSDLGGIASELGMATLVEIHGERELEKIDFERHPLLGINNRNLSTMRVDRGTTGAIARLLPPGVRFVSESGLRSAADVREAYAVGAAAVLMGEAFMRSPEPGLALKGVIDEFHQD